MSWDAKRHTQSGIYYLKCQSSVRMLSSHTKKPLVPLHFMQWKWRQIRFNWIWLLITDAANCKTQIISIFAQSQQLRKYSVSRTKAVYCIWRWHGMGENHLWCSQCLHNMHPNICCAAYCTENDCSLLHKPFNFQLIIIVKMPNECTFHLHADAAEWN